MHSSKSVQIYKYYEKSNASHCIKSSFKSLRNGSSRTTSSLKAVQNQNVRLNQRWRVASGAFKPFYFIVCITLQCIWIVAVLSLISCSSVLKSSNLKHFSQSSFFRSSYQFFTCDENENDCCNHRKRLVRVACMLPWWQLYLNWMAFSVCFRKSLVELRVTAHHQAVMHVQESFLAPIKSKMLWLTGSISNLSLTDGHLK